MLLFYQERMYLLVSLLVILLDGIIIYYIPEFYNQLNYFYPMLTISIIPFSYLCSKKKYYLFILVMGIIYDLLYSNILLYNTIIFILLINIDVKIINDFEDSLLLFILLSLLNIVIYDTIGFLLVILTSYQSITIYDLIYKIDHSILLNIMSVFVFWFLFKKRLQHT